MSRSELDLARRRFEIHTSARLAQARAAEACLAARELCAEARRLRDGPKQFARERPA